MSTRIYGASDDLVEVDGDIREEFTYDDAADRNVLGFSDGTILSIEYDRDGVWRIKPIVRGSSELLIEQAPADDEDNYSDSALLSGAGLRWVVFGTEYATAAAASTGEGTPK